MGEILKQGLWNWASGCWNGTGSTVEVCIVTCDACHFVPEQRNVIGMLQARGNRKELGKGN